LKLKEKKEKGSDDTWVDPLDFNTFCEGLSNRGWGRGGRKKKRKGLAKEREKESKEGTGRLDAVRLSRSSLLDVTPGEKRGGERKEEEEGPLWGRERKKGKGEERRGRSILRASSRCQCRHPVDQAEGKKEKNR